MRRRQTTLRGHTRLHQPCVTEPLVVVIIDELAALTAYCTDRDARRRIAAALSLLLSQGRAVGITVIGALQDPRKDVLPFRDLFPLRIALRVTESEHVDMILGSGARARGARCDAIPESLPGIGYVVVDGIAEPIRVRFAHLTDTAIDTVDTQASPTPALDASGLVLRAVDDSQPTSQTTVRQQQHDRAGPRAADGWRHTAGDAADGARASRLHRRLRAAGEPQGIGLPDR